MEITSGGVRLTDLPTASHECRGEILMSPTQPKPGDANERWDLRLYVAGQTDKSLRAINNLNRSARSTWKADIRSK